MGTQTKTKRKLRIVHGAGQGHEIDADQASRYSGTARDVLRQIVNEHIRDPQLLATLNDNRLALDQFYEDENQGAHEQPLSPDADWAGLVNQLQETDVELGVARSHAGG